MFILECCLVIYILIGYFVSMRIFKILDRTIKEKDFCENCIWKLDDDCDEKQKEECSLDDTEIRNGYEMISPTLLLIAGVFLWLPTIIYVRIEEYFREE